MNGKQRIDSVLKGEWPDKRPVLLHNFLLAAKEFGVSMKQYREDPEIIAQSHIKAIEKYDLDGALIDIDTATLAGAVGVPVDYPENNPARIHRPLLLSIDKVKDLEFIDISKNTQIQIWLEACTIIKKNYGDEKYIRGNCDQAAFSLASSMRSPGEWMTDLIVEDQLVFKLLDFCTNATCQFIRLMIQTGVDMVSNGDSIAGPEMISPEMYQKYALPYEKKIVEEAHKLGTPYLLHICGNTDMILENMIETKADVLELDYKTNIQLVHDICKKKNITFSGNIDPSGILAFGTPTQVEKKTKEILTIFKDNPRLIMNAGCAIPPETPEENIRKLVEITRS